MAKLMSSKAKINLLRDLRQTNPIKWLPPNEYLFFLAFYPRLEEEIRRSLDIIRFTENKTIPLEQAMGELSISDGPLTNLNPRNRQGKPRYPWSRKQLGRLRSLKGTL